MNDHRTAAVNAIVSSASAVASWFLVANEVLTLMATAVAIVSGVCAARYYIIKARKE